MAQNKQPISSLKVTKQAWANWISLKNKLLLIALIATVVGQLIIFLSGNGVLIVELWYVLILSALIWFLSRATSKKSPSIKEAFYEGTSSLVKQILIFMVWVVFMIPFILGAVLAQQVNMYQFGASGLELAGFNSLWLVLGLLSIYWIFRSWLSPLYVNEGMTPIAALKASWAFTRKRIGWISRVLALAILVAILPFVVIYALYFAPLPANIWVNMTLTLAVSYVGYAFTLPFLITASLELKRNEPRRKQPRKR